MSTLDDELSDRALNRLAVILDRDSPGRIDWKGLADRMNFTTGMVLALENSRERSPTKALLKEWQKIAGSDANTATLIGLLDSFGCGEGVDILTEELAKKFRRMQIEDRVSPQPSQRSESSSEDSMERIPMETTGGGSISMAARSGRPAEINDLTGSMRYDVFLSYAEEDSDFAAEMRDRLVRANFRVFIPSDVMPGTVFHQEIANMIKEICSKTIIILSPDYVNSPWCNYEANLAQSASPDARRHMLIPVLYRHCKIPNSLQPLYYSDYPRYKNDKHRCEEFFWGKLYRSLRNKTDPI